ncbi:MAG: PilZ domain-containing protein [Deltaproteobacteria bacterium]|nr:MAG: PilZ domain-containing protein [Deltaproteobacteria bacterium]
MSPDGSAAGRYSVLVRLFELINKANEEQQLSLLKYLHQGNLSSPLFKCIIDMSHEEQLALLVQLKEMSFDEMPEKTITLDERESARTPCFLAVDYQAEDSKHTKHILDISTGGVFIETIEPIAVGQEITLNFAFPESQEPLKVSGKIIWRNPKGIGVKFTGITDQQVDRIKKYIAQKEQP